MFRLDIRDNALKTKVSNKYDRKNLGEWNNLTKVKPQELLRYSIVNMMLNMDLPQTTWKWFMVRLRNNLTSGIVCFLVSLTPKPSISFTPTAFTDNSVHQIYQTSHGISWLQHSWPPNNSRLADFLFDPSVSLGPCPCSIFFGENTKNAETKVTTTPIY